MEHVDYSSSTSGDLRQVAEEEAASPFNLSDGPLIKIRSLVYSIKDSVLLFTVHHLVFDAPSIRIFLSELAESYRKLTSNTPSSDRSEVVQYRNFVSLERERYAANGDIMRSELQEYLDGRIAALKLPLDHIRPRQRNFAGTAVTQTLSRELSDTIRHVSRGLGVTPFTAFVTGYAVLLHAYSGQDDLIIGSAATTRYIGEFQESIGCFINLVPIRVKLWGNPTLEELVSRIRLAAAQALRFQHYPFAKVVETLNPTRDASHHVLVQAAMGFGRDRNTVHDFCTATGTPVTFPDTNAEFDLYLDITDTGETFRIIWQFSEELFEAATIQRMQRHFANALEAMTKADSLRVSHVPLITDEGKRAHYQDLE